MIPIDVLKMLMEKIKISQQNNMNYTLQPNDVEEIEKSLLSNETCKCKDVNYRYGIAQCVTCGKLKFI